MRSLRTTTDFPHGLTITVNAYEPVAALRSGADLTPVAADGTILRGSVDARPPRRRRAHRPPAPAASATPGPCARSACWLPRRRAARRVSRVYRGPTGLTATLENGPKLYFGGSGAFAAKWGAAAAVLADGTSKGARYIDLRVPERPAAGGLKPRTPDSQPQL